MKTKIETVTRRALVHQATREEILDLARQQIAAAGAPALSLRAIARAMKVTAPALYRYFPNRDELVTELIIAAFRSLADTLQAARDARPENAHAARLFACAVAYRKWALAHPQDYLLIFGTPIPGYVAPAERTLPEAKCGFDVLVDELAATHKQGDLNLPAEYARPPAALQAQLSAWKKNYGYTAPIAAMYVALVCWYRLHGIVSLELDHQLQPMLGDANEFYRAQVSELLQNIGLKAGA
ncbi:MAG: TetR/AcrR family transcriptional regulator [Chloroflexi bacterium]|nr:TetR/AcrR family transcriptional regulator [Chloroflexota bacterium]